MISLYPSAPASGGKAPAPAPGPIRLYNDTPAPKQSNLPASPAVSPSVNNLGGAPPLAMASGLPLASPASTTPTVTPIPKVPSNLPLQAPPQSPFIGTGGDGTVLRAPTPDEAAKMPKITPAQTITNSEKAKESLAANADQYATTGKGPVPLPSEKNYAPGQNMYIPGGGSVRIPQGGLSGATKATVELPERLANDVKDAVNAVRGKGFDTSERVPSFENDSYNAYQAAKDVGYSENQSTAIGVLQGVGTGIIDATILQGLFGSASEAIVKATAHDLEQISAWQLLDKPGTPAQAEANWKTLSHEFHPDMLGGSTKVQSKLNDAISVIRDKGVPSDVKATLNKIFSKFTPQLDNAASMIDRSNEINQSRLKLPAAGETSQETVAPIAEAVKPPEAAPVSPAEPAAPAPYKIPEISGVPSKLPPPIQNNPVVDLSPATVEGNVRDIVGPERKPSMQDTIISKLSQPKPGAPVRDVVPPPRPTIDQIAYQNTAKNGGTTISLQGNQPSEGISFAPSKDTEFSVPEEKFTHKVMKKFISDHMDELQKPGNHVGTWVADGRVYMDVSQVGPKGPETLEKAMLAKQLGAFDLGAPAQGKNGNIPLGKIDKGVYTKLYGKATDHPYLSSRENSPSGGNGGNEERSSLPKSVQSGIGEAPAEKPISALDSAPAARPSAENGVKSPTKVVGNLPKENPPVKINASASGPGKTSGLGSKIKAQALADGLKADFGDLPHYKTANAKEQADKFLKLLEENRDEAKMIAMGEKDPPAGLLPETVWKGLKMEARAARDTQALIELAHSKIVTEASIMGQRIQALDERDPLDPVNHIKEINKAKDARIEKSGKSIKNDARKISKAVRTIKIRPDWRSYIQSIEC